MIVAGVDLSLTATGVAILDEDAEPVVATIRSKGKREDSLYERRTRLHGLSRKVFDLVQEADLIVVEQPAYSQTSGSHHDRSGLWWLVVDELLGEGFNVVEVPPSTLKKYVTGKGTASKMEIMAKLIRLLPEVGISNDNEADALGLALMGRRRIESELEPSLPLVNLKAMEAVRWT